MVFDHEDAPLSTWSWKVAPAGSRRDHNTRENNIAGIEVVTSWKKGHAAIHSLVAPALALTTTRHGVDFHYMYVIPSNKLCGARWTAAPDTPTWSNINSRASCQREENRMGEEHTTLVAFFAA